MRIDGGGIRVGEKLDGFRGVLTGTPVYGGRGKLLEERGD
jgi:circadian clock protein KaiC